MSYMVIGGWGDRHESPESCCDRLRQALIQLNEAGLSGVWYGGAHQFELSVGNIDERALVALVRDAQTRDDDGHVVKQLGYSFHLRSDWGRSVLLFHISAGVVGSPRVPNRLILKSLPGERVVRMRCDAIVAALAQSWDADWVTLVSRRRFMKGARDSSVPVVGATMFVSRSLPQWGRFASAGFGVWSTFDSVDVWSCVRSGERFDEGVVDDMEARLFGGS